MTGKDEEDGYRDGVRDGKLNAHERRIADLEDSHKGLLKWFRGVATLLFGAMEMTKIMTVALFFSGPFGYVALDKSLAYIITMFGG